jgi:hypothetical protein
MLVMHPTLMTVIANEHNYELRANAAHHRRARAALSRSRRALARRRARPLRPATV